MSEKVYPTSKIGEKEERLALALRENLYKRKQQKRERDKLPQRQEDAPSVSDKKNSQ